MEKIEQIRNTAIQKIQEVIEGMGHYDRVPTGDISLLDQSICLIELI